MQHELYSDAEHGPAATLADTVHALIRFLQLALHRIGYIIAALVVAGLLGGLYYFTATPIYRATAQLLILQSGPDVWSPSMTAESSRQALIPTYERLFSTQEVLDGAIQQLAKQSPEVRVDFESTPQHKWGSILRENLSASAIRRTNVIEISYNSRSPKAAVAVVKAVVDSYLEFMERNHKDVSAEIVQILKQEQVTIQGKLAVKQQEMLDVQNQMRDLGIADDKNAVRPAVQRVMQLNESLVTVQQQRLQLEASLNAIRNSVRNGADVRQHLAAIEPLVGRELMMSGMGLNIHDIESRGLVERQLMEDEARLEALLEHYGDAHPKVRELSQAISSAKDFLANYQQMIKDRSSGLQDGNLGAMLIAMVEDKLANLREHEAKLTSEYELAENAAVQKNNRRAELTMIVHELDRLRKLNDTLIDRIANIDIGQNHSDVRVAVVSEAKASDGPISPKLPLIAVMCVFAGVASGCGLVYVMDVLDDRFRSPEELQQQVGAPMLAMIRNLATQATTGPQAVQVHVSPESVESEAFRTLRTTLAFSGRDLERIAITSTEPGDGKTTVLSNLGVSYAQAGKRTLVIDGDLRRPGLTKLFEMRGSGGLSEILRSNDPVDAMSNARVQQSGIPNLDVLPCGPKPSNPAELLSGPRLADLLAWAETHYDQVIVDCPPVLAASDAAIIGRLTEGLILVIQPQKNHRRLVLRAIQGLASIGVGVVGVVANKISDQGNSGYYGYGGYGYGYNEVYGEEAEPTDFYDDADDASEDYEEALTIGHNGSQRHAA